MAPRLRRGRPDELAALCALDDAACVLYEQAGVHLETSADDPFVQAEAERWGRALRVGGVWVAVDEDDQPLGFAATTTADGEPYLDQLAVHPRAMRQGVGRALLAEVIAQTARPGASLWLTTYAHLPWNRPYYEREGFVVVPEDQLGPELTGLLEDQRRHLPQPRQRVAMRRPY